VALVIIAAIAFGVHKAVTNTHHTVTLPQQTVLLQIQGPDKTALGSVLLAHNPNNGQGVEVLVPSQLITDVCGVGQVTLGQTLASPNGGEVSRQAVSAALGGIDVKGSWVLSTTMLAKLVDAVGGVTVNVDTDVISHNANGTATIDIPSGSQHLTGAQAVEYATYRTSATEDAASQLVRLQEVVDALVRALPTTTKGVTDALGQVGTGGASTLGAGPLSKLLIGLAADDRRTGGVLPIDLPTTLIDTGGSPSYRVDTGKTADLVRNQLQLSLPPATKVKPVTVELRNGVGSPGLVATACPRLAAAKLVYAGQGNASSFDVAKSEVQINSNSATDRAQGASVARALRLPASDVTVAGLGQDQADVVVVLGRDYRP
jgi:anionic cell wall polymer biosynthesis LytR-Cps2A-Psr (LCP) family protein